MERDEDWVVFDPQIRGGEPIVRGSRISPYTLVMRLEHGESDEVLDDDLPHIPPEGREAVKRWVQQNPRQRPLIEPLPATDEPDPGA
ncbi:MAG: hypothetical protein JWM31_1505 [Solirubrobacterales bacterium]|nr:hypothetical protein [Solirubrobacterales bacterium]